MMLTTLTILLRLPVTNLASQQSEAKLLVNVCVQLKRKHYRHISHVYANLVHLDAN